MVRIVLHVQSPEESDAEKALRTFYGYAHSWCLHAGDSSELLERQTRLRGFQQLQGGATSDGVAGPYLRGCLTLRTMTALPIDEHPELAATANFWVPVQAYYACHGFGLATIAALGIQIPSDHRRFLASMSSDVLPRLFPVPFSYLCDGDPVHSTAPVNFPGAGFPAEDVINSSNLSNPGQHNAHLLTVKSLMTTRRWWLQEILSKQRVLHKKPGRSRRNISGHERKQVADKLHKTSLLDFLYRMRVRSNYDDPEMFIYGRTDLGTAAGHYGHLVRIVDAFRVLSSAVIERRIGSEGLKKILEDSPLRKKNASSVEVVRQSN